MQLSLGLEHRNDMHIYDYLIIGSGLTGLSIAQKLSSETDNIIILEALDCPGGDNRVALLDNKEINNGLRFFPATDSAEKGIEFLEGLIGSNPVLQRQENNPETYEASGFKPFVGFGEKNVEFYEQLSYFLSSEEYVLAEQPFAWIQKFLENLKNKIQTKSIVTRFGFESQDSEEPKLTHVVVNGTKSIFARNFIFAGPVKDLGFLLPDEILSLRAKAKLKKSQAWQAVCLDLFHSVIVEKNNLFVLDGTTDDELGPCLGRFLKTIEIEGQVSQWISFVDAELAEDTENIGHVLKKMKRQIKRAFPAVADSIKKERIFVTQALSGSDLKLTGHLTIPKVDNLWIASSQLSRSKNILGSLKQAQLVLAAMGFQTGVGFDSVPTEELEPAISFS